LYNNYFFLFYFHIPIKTFTINVMSRDKIDLIRIFLLGSLLRLIKKSFFRIKIRINMCLWDGIYAENNKKFRNRNLLYHFLIQYGATELSYLKLFINKSSASLWSGPKWQQLSYWIFRPLFLGLVVCKLL